MRKPTYLDGLKEAQRMLEMGLTLDDLREFLNGESLLLDYRWCNWVEGFNGGIEHFKGLGGGY